MSSIKPGTLCVVVGAVETPGLLNRFVIAESKCSDNDVLENGWRIECDGLVAWICRSAVDGDLLPTSTLRGRLFHLRRRAIAEVLLKPINDDPGNEQFVTELRNKLPRSKPATTKQDTINERGELA